MPELANTVDRFRNPAYTRENRCTPCTLLNIFITLLIGVVIGFVRPPVGLAFIAISLVVIYFRGYLIPGTPTLTQRYLPDRVLRWFGKETTAAVAPEEGVEHIGELLEEAGIAIPCEAGDDLCLDEQFADVWWRRINQCRVEATARDRLAARIEVDPDGIAFVEDGRGGPFAVTYEEDVIGRWASRGAFLADLAAEPTLAEWIDGWYDLRDQSRTELLARSRVFLTNCPSCDAPLTEVEDVTKTCCSGSITRVNTECTECGGIIFTGSTR